MLAASKAKYTFHGIKRAFMLFKRDMADEECAKDSILHLSLHEDNLV